jgi:hypothetical protein
LKEDLRPHAPLLVLFASSAQTHIFPEIRIDGARFVDLLLQHIPHSTVFGWDNQTGGNRILPGYLGILNADIGSDSSGCKYLVLIYRRKINFFAVIPGPAISATMLTPAVRGDCYGPALY